MNTTTVTLTVDALHRLDGGGTVKAFADLTIGGALLVKGFRVVDGKEGLFIGMPRHPNKEGQWFDNVRPMTREFRQQLSDLVLAAYHDTPSPSTE